MQKKVTVIGGLNIDIKAKGRNALIAGDSNPSSIEISAGGVGRNIAHNLALLGIPTTLLSAASGDSESQLIIEQTARAGVNMNHLLISQSKKTGKYIAILDSTGEMALAVSDMEILEELNIEYLQSKLDIIKGSDFLVCDTNLSMDCLRFIIYTGKACNIPICIDPVSVTKAAKLIGLLDGIDILKPNGKELTLLTGIHDNIEEASKMLTTLGVKAVIATLGSQGLCYTNTNKSTYYPSIAASIVDVTGAGDSLTAGLIYGLLQFDSFHKACLCGLAAAAITLSSKDTVSSSLSSHAVLELIAEL